jgi:hypothetical protein
MTHKIFRSFEEPDRENLSWEELWEGPDKGLITCWEVGRKLRLNNSELAKKAEDGELPALGWKGGVEKRIQKGEKYGTLYYLAQWQGLRGDDLNINLAFKPPELICSKTGMRVIYTADIKVYGNS